MRSLLLSFAVLAITSFLFGCGSEVTDCRASFYYGGFELQASTAVRAVERLAKSHPEESISVSALVRHGYLHSDEVVDECDRPIHVYAARTRRGYCAIVMADGMDCQPNSGDEATWIHCYPDENPDTEKHAGDAQETGIDMGWIGHGTNFRHVWPHTTRAEAP